MDLTEIMSITGKPGLFKMVANVKNGLIVESLLDGKRFPVFAHERISSLEEISIYTYEEDMPLREIFKIIFEKLKGETAKPYMETAAKQKEFFKTVVPNYDEERVYTSHIKKLLSWYCLLLDKNLLSFEEDNETQENEDPAAESTEK